MNCRRIKTWIDENGNKRMDIVWFGSYGKNVDGTAKFFSETKHDNYATQQEAVANSLTQRLNVLKGELWYAINYGIPLIDKLKSKTTLDAFVATTISSHPNVVNILEFTSSIKNRKYSCNVRIMSEYGALLISI